MNACRWEAEMLRAATDDRWTENLRRHLAECDDCVAVVAVAPWMNGFARMSDRDHILPDPSVVWLKAKLLQGGADMARASRPITIIQLVAYLVVAGGWAAVLMWKWESVLAWTRGLDVIELVTASRAESVSLMFVGAILTLAAMTVTLAMHTILAEE
jgi:hypothetical protein